MTRLYIPLDLIQDNPFQRRVEYGELDELAGQISAAVDQYPESRGVMQTPRARIVDPAGHAIALAGVGMSDLSVLHDYYRDHKIQLLYGHRRVAALRLLAQNDPRYSDGLALIELTPATDEQMLDAVWAENAQRRNLSAVEEARLMADALAALSNGAKYTQKSLAERWGIAQPTVANRLRLLQLPEQVQAANRQGIISERVAVALLDVQKLVDADWKVSEWESMAPADVLAKATAGDMTSDDIRKKVYNWILMGDRISPEMEAEPVQAVGIIQEKCRGCPFNLRANDRRCINATCYATKARVLATSQATAVARDLVLEYQHDAYIEEELKYWSKNHRHASTLYNALNDHLDLIGEHIIVTANLDKKFLQLPSYDAESGRWHSYNNGRRYSIVATSRLTYEELLDLLPATAETADDDEDAPAIEIDYEAQPLGRRYEWYTGQLSAATITAEGAIERHIETAVEELNEDALTLFCNIFDTVLSADPIVNESRLSSAILEQTKRPYIAETVKKLGVEPGHVNRATAEAIITATLADYIDATRLYGVLPFAQRRYGAQFQQCHAYATAHNINGQLLDDLRTALEQCDVNPEEVQ